MRIVDRKTFLSMPEGTVYSKYEPCIFGSLSIKGESLKNDFYVQEIADAIACSGSNEFDEICDQAQRRGASLKMDFSCEGRDGLYEDEQFFAVWEKADVEALILRLSRTL